MNVIDQIEEYIGNGISYTIEILPDDDAFNPLEDCDGMGGIIDLRFGCTAKLPENYIMLDVYAHGNEAWAVAGDGMQCRWDTSRNAGAWYPDKCLIDELKSIPESDRQAKLVQWAKEACTLYNAWINGEFCGHIVTTYFDGIEHEQDSCWGYESAGRAMQEAKSIAETMVKEIKKHTEFSITSDAKQGAAKICAQALLEIDFLMDSFFEHVYGQCKSPFDHPLYSAYAVMDRLEDFENLVFDTLEGV